MADWIRKAAASIKRRGTKGKCTPITKPGCTGRARALALTFKKIARNRKHKQDGGEVEDQDRYEELQAPDFNEGDIDWGDTEHIDNTVALYGGSDRVQNGSGEESPYGPDSYSGTTANSFLQALQQQQTQPLTKAEDPYAEQLKSQQEQIDELRTRLSGYDADGNKVEQDANENNDDEPGSIGFQARLNAAFHGSEFSPEMLEEMNKRDKLFVDFFAEQTNMILSTLNGEDDEGIDNGTYNSQQVMPPVNTPPVEGASTNTETVPSNIPPVSNSTGFREYVTPQTSEQIIKQFAKAENSGKTEMVKHSSDPKQSAKGPFGFMKGKDHLYDIFNNSGAFTDNPYGAQYRKKYSSYAQFFDALSKDPALAHKVNTDYTNVILNYTHGDLKAAAALNLAGFKGLSEYQRGNLDYRNDKNNASLREYFHHMGLKQSGGKVLTGKHEKYVGLNDESIGDEVTIKNDGYNLYRGTDDGKPVTLKDVVGASHTLFGPEDTAWLYGDVYEHRG